MEGIFVAKADFTVVWSINATVYWFLIDVFSNVGSAQSLSRSPGRQDFKSVW